MQPGGFQCFRKKVTLDFRLSRLTESEGLLYEKKENRGLHRPYMSYEKGAPIVLDDMRQLTEPFYSAIW